MRANCCSWKCFATGLLIGTLLFITIAMIGGLVAIPVIYVHCPKDYHQVRPVCGTCTVYIMSTICMHEYSPLYVSQGYFRNSGQNRNRSLTAADSLS